MLYIPFNHTVHLHQHSQESVHCLKSTDQNTRTNDALFYLCTLGCFQWQKLAGECAVSLIKRPLNVNQCSVSRSLTAVQIKGTCTQQTVFVRHLHSEQRVPFSKWAPGKKIFSLSPLPSTTCPSYQRTKTKVVRGQRKPKGWLERKRLIIK